MPRVIAFYLPQFHPTPNNDRWYGKGFTEWTNVCKAKKLFPGHRQPNIPADLGFYDLRLTESRNAQAEMASKYGIEGFCYYHYRFNQDHHELDMPFNEVLKSGSPDFPFMLCWANESWYQKMWKHGGKMEKQIIVKQEYGGIDDYQKHFYELLPAFKDKRYIQIEEKPAFLIYKPLEFADVDVFISRWQELAIQNGLKGIFFIGQTIRIKEEKEKILSKGFSAVQVHRLREEWMYRSAIKKILSKTIRIIFRLPQITSYSKVSKKFIGTEDLAEDVFPTIIPNWDHTPRSGRGGSLLVNSTPEKFHSHVIRALNVVKHKRHDRKIVFLMAWNEWGEGNYMEPDLRWGTKYLETLNEALVQQYY
jgi:hypothetical protein